MKEFLKNILSIVLPIAFVAYPADVIISYQLKKNNTFASGEYSTWNDLYHGDINAEMLIYGSSRAWVHIDPEMLEKNFERKTYNLGIDGHNFWLQLLRHKTYSQLNLKPKYIIYSLDVHTLSKREDLFNLEQFIPYMLFNTEIKEYTSSYDGFSNVDFNVPIVRFRRVKNLLSGLVNSFNSEPMRIKGFYGVDRTWNNDLLNAQKENEDYQVIQDSVSIGLFHKFLTECKESNIKIIFVYTPEYIDGQNFVKNREEIFSQFTILSEKFDIPFLNYSNDDICSKKEYFYNASHLNEKGSEIFTQKLVKDLKSRNLILIKDLYE
jgi:hypothetical protein